jgi:hypothetical protein
VLRRPGEEGRCGDDTVVEPSPRLRLGDRVESDRCPGRV